MLVKIYPENPNQNRISQIVDVLRDGGIIIFPTDTIYGIGCDITNHKAVEKVARIKGIRADKANFSFICFDLSHLSDYTKQVNNETFKLMKRNLPGPFTFILNASGNVPKLFKSKKKTVGIRVPDNNIIREIVKELGNPVMSTSVRAEDQVVEYITDPEFIYEKYAEQVDIVIDGGYGGNQPSTIVDCTGDEILIIREGKEALQ
ncbi:L-threonylcarbamoyladenylate synthase [Bacteroidota bacterium]